MSLTGLAECLKSHLMFLTVTCVSFTPIHYPGVFVAPSGKIKVITLYSWGLHRSQGAGWRVGTAGKRALASRYFIITEEKQKVIILKGFYNLLRK